MVYFLCLLPVLLIVYYDYRIKTPFIGFSITLSALYFISFPLIKGNYNDWVGEFVSIWAFLFFSFYFLFRMLFSCLLKINVGAPVIRGNYNRDDLVLYGKVSLMFLMISVFLSLYSYGFSLNSMLVSNWSDSRNEGGILLVFSFYLFMCGSSFLLISILLKNKVNIIISLILIVYYVVFIKTRGYLVAFIMPVIIYFLLTTKWSFRRVIMFFLSLVFFVFCYLITRVFRLAGSFQSVISDPSVFYDALVPNPDDFGEFSLLDSLFYILSNNVVSNHLDQNATLIRLLTFFIPDGFIEKPQDVSSVVWDIYIGVAGVNGSYHPTAIGESYLNNSHYGYILYPLLLVLIFTIYERLLLIKGGLFSILTLGLVVFSMFAFTRGASYNAFSVLTVCTVLILFSISTLKKRFV